MILCSFYNPNWEYVGDQCQCWLSLCLVNHRAQLISFEVVGVHWWSSSFGVQIQQSIRQWSSGHGVDLTAELLVVWLIKLVLAMRCRTYSQSIKFRYKLQVQLSEINQLFFLFCFLWAGECFATWWSQLILIAAPEDPLLESVRPLNWAVFTMFLYWMNSDQEQVIYSKQGETTGQSTVKTQFKPSGISNYICIVFSNIFVHCCCI